MKATHYFFTTAAASLMIIACNKENGQTINDGQLRLSTENTIQESLKSAAQDLQLVQFANGEQVHIFLMEDVSGTPTASGENVTTYTQPLTYTANGTGGLSNTQYWPTSGNGLHIYGVYPSGDDLSFDSTGNSFSILKDQSSENNYKASDLMTGKPENNPVTRTTSIVPLTFTHLLTKVDINLTEGDGFSEGDLANAKVYIQNTKPTTTFNVQNTTVGTASGDASDITVCTGTKGSAIIVPQTVAANAAFIKVVISGGEYIYKLAAQTAFQQSSVYTYNITVNKTGLNVSSTITKWVSVGTATSGTATLQ